LPFRSVKVIHIDRNVEIVLIFGVSPLVVTPGSSSAWRLERSPTRSGVVYHPFDIHTKNPMNNNRGKHLFMPTSHLLVNQPGVNLRMQIDPVVDKVRTPEYLIDGIILDLNSCHLTLSRLCSFTFRRTRRRGH
jgi:hypothetical protein